MPATTTDFEGYDDLPFRALMQDLEPAMTGLKAYTLTEKEVEVVYLALARLDDLEKFGHARDWESIRSYCPRDDDPDEDDA